MTAKHKIQRPIVGHLAFNLAGLLLIFASWFVAPAAAQAYKVERVVAAPPQELAPAVRDVLAGESIRVTGPNGTLYEIWLRKAVPTKANAAPELGIALGQLEEGTLVAAIRFSSQVVDYRQQRVKPGVYTLRYALLPVNGDHLGVSPIRDFLLPAPAASDTVPANISRDDVLKLGRKVTGGSHPSVWSLTVPEAASGTGPSMVHQEDGDLWIVRFSIQFQPAGAPTGAAPSSGGPGEKSLKAQAPAAASTVIGLVVVGHAPEA